MHRSFTFNGTRKDWLYLLRGRQESPYAPINHTMVHVPGMAGAHFVSTETDVLYVSQPVGFKVENEEHEQELLDELKKWLITTDDVEIQFDNVPGKTYIGRVTASMNDYSRQGNLRSGTLTFLCKPYKYGPELSFQVPSHNISLTNNGTAEATPIFELEVLAPITFAMIQNQNNEYMMIGRPFDESESPIERYTSVFVDNASTLTGWAVVPGGTQIDGGIVGGNMGVQGGYAFYAQTFGENPNGWVGPAIKKSLTKPVQDFRMVMDMEMLNRQGNVGKVVIALLDELDNVICSVQMVDAANSAWKNRAIVRVGNSQNGTNLIDHAPEQGGWNDFRGILRMERIGNQFLAYVARVQEDGNHTGRLNSQPYYDTLGEFQAPVAQVRVYIAKSKSYAPFPMFFHGGNVWEINDLGVNQVPYIADIGDKIVFDHTKNGEVLLNGEPFEDIDFGSSFFKLEKGTNQLVTQPSNAIKTKVRYRERYR
ncbi:distal tail protein Dit [Paucisalibacillus globulus]|uniref:distal tail protein Dit n=1 Tax=Paucisalibacillus globulus TaxID=351095 RepID=UPI000BB8CB8C|nr:distal tail protein Dit [Paucisalibacillus globulus]